MRVGIIGCSGHIHLVNEGVRRNPDLKVVGIAPADEVDRAEGMAALAEEHGAPLYDSYQEMLDKEKPDVVGIGTRYDKNGPVTLECLERGIHCMTEKCIAHSFDLLDRIEQTAQAANVQVVGMHAMRYTQPFWAAYQAMKRGEIGKPVLFYGRKSYKFGNSRPDFYKVRDQYGGTILWVAAHAVDWAQWIMGDVDAVHALHTTECNFGYGECESATAMSLGFSNGSIGVIHADFYQPLTSDRHGDDQLRLAGDKGVIEVQYGKAWLTTHKRAKQELELEPEGDFFGDFCRVIRGEGTCRLSMADTLAVSRICLRARESADKGIVA